MSIGEIFGAVAGNQIAGSIILVLAAIAIRIGVKRLLVDRRELESDQRRRLLSNLRNGLLFALLVGLVLIWAPALRTFALSLTAFAVAIILATKELILCLSGTLLKTASGALRVGAWIEVNGIRGEVVDQTLMSTTIQELGSEAAAYEFTGRTVVLPNSLFLSVPIVNERFYKRYVFHDFHLVLDPQVDPAPVEEAMCRAVAVSMADQMEVARRYNALIEKRAGIDIRDPDPRCHLSSLIDGRLRVSVSAFLPTRQAVEIEQQAIRAGLAALRDQASLPAGQKSA